MNLAGLADAAAQLGAFGVAIIVLWALLTERLVPRGRLDDVRAERDQLRAERDLAIHDVDLERARHDARGEPPVLHEVKP